MPTTIEARRAQTANATRIRLERQAARRSDPDAATEWIEEQIRKAPPLTADQIVRISGLLYRKVDGAA